MSSRVEFNSVCFVAAGQVLLRAGLEVGLVPAATAQAKAWHGQHLFQLGCPASRAIDQRRVADLLNGFQLMTTGSALIIVHGHGMSRRSRQCCAAPRTSRYAQQRARLYPLNRGCAAVATYSALYRDTRAPPIQGAPATQGRPDVPLPPALSTHEPHTPP